MPVSDGILIGIEMPSLDKFPPWDESSKPSQKCQGAKPGHVSVLLQFRNVFKCCLI
jgi:hypothetical protein